MASEPDLKVPPSHSTVRVRIIDTTTYLEGLPAAYFFAPEIPGHSTASGPSYSFLIEHGSSRSLLFDLGIRKDWQNLPPAIANLIKFLKCTIGVQKGVREQLEEHNVDVKKIEGIIWSHAHWDHVGDPSTFDKSTALIVGPGVIENYVPGYPTNPDGRILESDYEGRELREIAFDQGLKIGGFDAFDYFGDGSFYLLNSPGHAVGHICGLARVTSSPNSFIFMGGDVCHHVGQFRPSQWRPLPALISPNPLNQRSLAACPGELFEHLLRESDREKSFYVVARPHDADASDASVAKVQETDALDEVLVVIAHDTSLKTVATFFPKYADEFLKNGWVQNGRWLFLKDFADAVRK